MISATIARRAGGAIALLALAAAAVLALGLPAQAQDQSVSMEDIAFVPADITVNVGDTVTWTHNDGPIPHTVTSGAPGADTGVFDSGTMNEGETFSFTFNEAGQFDYYCVIHPQQMQGTVTVQGGEEPTPTTPAEPTPTTPPDDDDPTPTTVPDDDDDATPTAVPDDDDDDEPTPQAPPVGNAGLAADGGSSTNTWLAGLLAGLGAIGLAAAGGRRALSAVMPRR